jgi:hypothetical protein
MSDLCLFLQCWAASSFLGPSACMGCCGDSAACTQCTMICRHNDVTRVTRGEPTAALQNIHYTPTCCTYKLEQATPTIAGCQKYWYPAAEETSTTARTPAIIGKPVRQRPQQQLVRCRRTDLKRLSHETDLTFVGMHGRF